MGEKKNILILGGSYFAGRVFVMVAPEQDYAITVINRGRYSVRNLGDVTELVCDRHDMKMIKSLPLDQHYDAVIDFCAYEPGDIDKVIEHLPCDYDQYIYISTADVCAPAASVRNEESELLQKAATDPVSQYTYKKMLLENELKQAASKKGCSYTILRPVFIYGPYNYAPRESWYIQRIIAGQVIPHPTDAAGRFQMVYVKDVSRALLLSIGNPKAENQIFILSAPEIMTYDSFLHVLQAVSDRKIQVTPVITADVIAQNIPLPFPLTEQENALFDGSKIERELGFFYGNQRDYMQLTWNAFRDVFEEGEAK